jgi:hypothetical protein
MHEEIERVIAVHQQFFQRLGILAGRVEVVELLVLLGQWAYEESERDTGLRKRIEPYFAAWLQQRERIN